MEKYIKIAIENGYSYPWKNEELFSESKGVQRYVCLDPLFWQSLGRGLGWKTACYKSLDTDGLEKDFQGAWVWYWHRFIDHLAEGKDIESFFNNLLNTK